MDPQKFAKFRRLCCANSDRAAVCYGRAKDRLEFIDCGKNCDAVA
ncbi:hypothetical protein [uncultured Campylobacter sp.]|nr:hypothetical protein [uncultured Campylobacter sp.]